jgi:hypothetical protein
MNPNKKPTTQIGEENINIAPAEEDIAVAEEEKPVDENINPNDQLKKLLRYYLANIEAERVAKKEADDPTNPAAVKRNKHVYPEFEIRFGTKGPHRISKIDYDNVKKVLASKDFQFSQLSTRLDIHTRFQAEGGLRDSQVRVEIRSPSLIQEYCKTNKLTAEYAQENSRSIKFVQKTPVLDETGTRLDEARFSDFNFSVSYKNEKNHYHGSERINSMLKNWENLPKMFRLIQRSRFKSNLDSKISIDMSVVRTSSKKFNGKYDEPLYTYTIDESNVFNNPVSYEIEVELNNDNIYPEVVNYMSLTGVVHRISKIILCGLQNTTYPISYTEKDNVLFEYANIIHLDKRYRLNPTNFIGPSSVTLQRHNIIERRQEIKEPNIRAGFAVTEKADGERHLLLITSKGVIYLLNTSMNVVSTGTHTKNEAIFNTIIDGELIRTNKTGKCINRFASFDIYFLNGIDIRSDPLILTDKKSRSRINLLTEVVDKLGQVPNPGVGSAYISVSVKTFLHSDNIFADCNEILSNTFDYNIDGLIFTHRTFGVGSNSQGMAGPLRLRTWAYSFKWKPSEYNTIDFLISTTKDSTNKDIITPVFNNGKSSFYKTVVLKCGYNEKDHGYMNPIQDVIDNVQLKNMEEGGGEPQYRPEQFVPREFTNPFAGICQINLRHDRSNVEQMMTTENDIIMDDTIVEFMFNKEKYEDGRPIQQCWMPIRNRVDKTEKYKKGFPVYGNAFHTANSNWSSIHSPITKGMICGMEPIPEIEISSEVYYNNSSKKSHTDGLRNFHNTYVKKMLIWCVSKPGDKLIDYGCGKGGDLSKWINRDLSFILGIDYSKDNIENKVDGAYARYLTNSRRHMKVPNALFANGDCSKNIRNGDAIEGDLYKDIVRSVFGQGDKSEFDKHDRIQASFGLGTNGFNVSSCQFAVHYFFRNEYTFHNFLRNVSECTAMNGYFVGTCYDGHTIMRELANYALDDGLRIYEDRQLICEIRKKYDTEEFEDDASSLGKEILVYQDTINQYLPEFLVNFRYLTRMIQLYGFELLSRSECKQINLPTSSFDASSEGMFKSMFRMMELHPGPENADALKMTENEKRISFLNRYFVFKKVREINAESVANSFIRPTVADPTIVGQEEKIEPLQDVSPLYTKIKLKSNTDVSPPAVVEVEQVPAKVPVKTKSSKTKKQPPKLVGFNVVDTFSNQEPTAPKITIQEPKINVKQPNKGTIFADVESGEIVEIPKRVEIPEPVVQENPTMVEPVIQEKPKRKYTKKTVVAEPGLNVEEVKPKRKYTKKTKAAEI